MGFKLKDILNVVTDIIPLGTVVKTLGKGVGALLTKKVAKVTGIKVDDVEKVLVKTAQEIENDHTIKKMLLNEAKAERKHQLDVFGGFAELDSTSQKLRARIRPILSLSLVGVFELYALVFLIQQIFPHFLGLEFMIVFPTALVTITKWVCGFWFGGRTVEKVVGLWKNGK